MQSFIPLWCHPGNLPSLSWCLEIRAGVITTGSFRESVKIRWLERVSYVLLPDCHLFHVSLCFAPIIKLLSSTNLVLILYYDRGHLLWRETCLFENSFLQKSLIFTIIFWWWEAGRWQRPPYLPITGSGLTYVLPPAPISEVSGDQESIFKLPT